MKKLIVLTVLSSMFVTTLTPSVANAVEAKRTKEDALVISDSRSAREIYDDIIKEKKDEIEADKLARSRSRNKPNEYMSSDFEVINALDADTSNKKIIYESETEGLYSAIEYDGNSGVYTLVEASEGTDYIDYSFNGEDFKLVAEGDDLNLYSENGNVIPVFITETLNTPEQTYVQSRANDYDYWYHGSRVYFGSYHGPVRQTNKMLVEFLGHVSTIGGVIAEKVKHPVLGKILLAVGLVSYAGQYGYATLYVELYQAHSTNFNGFCKQKRDYYQYNNYTGFVKSHIGVIETSRYH